jgi:hypothetical protein
MIRALDEKPAGLPVAQPGAHGAARDAEPR